MEKPTGSEPSATTEGYASMLSISLADGTRLKLGDCFTVDGVYPFFSDADENYNAEVCWDDDSKAMFYDIYPVSDRVRGAACGGSFEDIPRDQIQRRPMRA